MSTHRLFVPDELATLLRTSRRNIYVLYERGHIPGAVRVGRKLLFNREIIEAWLAAGGGIPLPKTSQVEIAGDDGHQRDRHETVGAARARRKSR